MAHYSCSQRKSLFEKTSPRRSKTRTIDDKEITMIVAQDIRSRHRAVPKRHVTDAFLKMQRTKKERFAVLGDFDYSALLKGTKFQKLSFIVLLLVTCLSVGNAFYRIQQRLKIVRQRRLHIHGHNNVYQQQPYIQQELQQQPAVMSIQDIRRLSEKSNSSDDRSKPKHLRSGKNQQDSMDDLNRRAPGSEDSAANGDNNLNDQQQLGIIDEQ